MPAPEGWWSFDVAGPSVGVIEWSNDVLFTPAFPNPANAITCVPIELAHSAHGTLSLVNALGQQVETIYEGEFAAGTSKFFFHAGNHSPGAYVILLELNGQGLWSERIMIR
jgi:hypothetical protein